MTREVKALPGSRRYVGGVSAPRRALASARIRGDGFATFTGRRGPDYGPSFICFEHSRNGRGRRFPGCVRSGSRASFVAGGDQTGCRGDARRPTADLCAKLEWLSALAPQGSPLPSPSSPCPATSRVPNGEGSAWQARSAVPLGLDVGQQGRLLAPGLRPRPTPSSRRTPHPRHRPSACSGWYNPDRRGGWS